MRNALQKGELEYDLVENLELLGHIVHHVELDEKVGVRFRLLLRQLFSQDLHPAIEGFVGTLTEKTNFEKIASCLGHSLPDPVRFSETCMFGVDNSQRKHGNVCEELI